MFEIQTNDHHYKHKATFLGALILVLGITVRTNVFAQKAVKISLPTDYTITQIESDVVHGDGRLDIIVSGDLDDTVPITSGSVSGFNLVTEQISPYEGSIESTTGVVMASGSISSGNTTDEVSDTALIYARKIEALISVKGQETRLNMIATMNNFLSKYSPEHPMYRIVMRIVEIITLGDIAHKVEYCTQFDGEYILELFGMPLDIYSTIKYNNQLQKCQITYQYPDRSVHTCRLNEQQKTLLSRAMKQKQGLNKFVPDWAFESVVEGFLAQGICFESQKSTTIIDNAGSLLSGSTMSWSVSTGVTVTSWWKNRGK